MEEINFSTFRSSICSNRPIDLVNSFAVKKRAVKSSKCSIDSYYDKEEQNTVGFAKCQTYSAVTLDGMVKLMVKIDNTYEVSKINHSKKFIGAVNTKRETFYEICSWSW